MEPKNINNRFEETQKTLRRRMLTCIFFLISGMIFTVVELFNESPWTKNKITISSLLPVFVIFVLFIRKIERRIQKNREDAAIGKRIKHTKSLF